MYRVFVCDSFNSVFFLVLYSKDADTAASVGVTVSEPMP